jgi:hypothetical protein
MGMQKVIINHVDGGTVEVLQHVESLDAKDLSKNQKKKLLKGYYSKEKHVAMLTSLMNGKHYNRKANNKKGLLPSQWDTVRQSQLPTWKQAHNEREQEKRI